ncbi:hypothetical protein VPH35_076856 [Triticum aestivum]
MCSAVVRKREVRRCRHTPSPPSSSGHIPWGPPAVERQLVPVLTSCRSATQVSASLLHKIESASTEQKWENSHKPRSSTAGARFNLPGEEGARAAGEESSTLPGSLPLLPPPPPAEEVGRWRQMGCSPLGSPSGSIAPGLQCGSS